MKTEHFIEMREHYEALGRISVNFSLLEFTAGSLFWALSGRDQQLSEIVTSQLGFRRLLATVSSLYQLKVKDQTKTDALRQLFNKAVELEELRNKYIHSLWLHNADSERGPLTKRVKVTASLKTGLRHQVETLDLKSLTKLGDDLIDCSQQLSNIHAQLSNE